MRRPTLLDDAAGEAMWREVSFAPTQAECCDDAPEAGAVAAGLKRGMRVVTLCALSTKTKGVVPAGARGRVVEQDGDVFVVAIDFDLYHKYTRVVQAEAADLMLDGDGFLRAGARVTCPALEVACAGRRTAIPRGAVGTITAVDAARREYQVSFDEAILEGVRECPVPCHAVQPPPAADALLAPFSRSAEAKLDKPGLRARLASKMCCITGWRRSSKAISSDAAPSLEDTVLSPMEFATSPLSTVASSSTSTSTSTSSVASSPLRSALKSRSRISASASSTALEASATRLSPTFSLPLSAVARQGSFRRPPTRTPRNTALLVSLRCPGPSTSLVSLCSPESKRQGSTGASP